MNVTTRRRAAPGEPFAVEDDLMRWFRMYSEARNDAKLRSLPDDQFRCWFNLLCLASEQPERGTIAEYTDHLLALETARGDVTLLETVCNSLQALRVLQARKCPVTGARTLVFLNFAERQYDAPSDAPERVRQRVAKYRAKKDSRKQAADSNAGNDHVTTPVTTTEQSRTEQRKKILAARGGGKEPAAAAEKGVTSPFDNPTIHEAIGVASMLFGPEAAAAVHANIRDIGLTLSGRWDCYVEALRKASDESRRPGAKRIDNLHALCLSIAKRLIDNGPGSSPVAVNGQPAAPAENSIQRRDREQREAYLQNRAAVQARLDQEYPE